MNRAFLQSWLATLSVALGVCLLSACTTRPKVDWNGRVGVYSYDQAILDYGPPDKRAELSDKSIVAEWLTRYGDYRIDSYGSAAGYYGRPYRPYGYYQGYAFGPHDVSRTPDRYLRLIFDPQGLLKGHHEFSK